MLLNNKKTTDAPPKINLKDQEVPNPAFEKALDDLDGMPMDDGSSSDWDGDEVCRFGKYRDVKWNKIVDAGWIEWVSQNSKVDWQRDLAKKELRRRGV